MRKTILYLVILCSLAFCIYYFVFRNDGSPYSGNEAGFAIKDTAAIGKLYLASSDGQAVTVERTDSGWMVNKAYKALPSTLNLLLLTLTQQSALYPVTKNAFDNVIKSLSTDGTKVEVYARDGKKMKVFYVGGIAVNNTGTNMLMDGAKTPYVVQVQGFNGYLTARYTPYLKDWRDRTVFNIPAEEIKTISVQYPDKPINSFEIIREKDTVLIKGDPEVTQHLDGPNIRRAKVYLKYFANVNCEGFLNGLPDNDTTLKTAPKRASIDVKGIHGQHQHVDIYWMALNRRSKNVTVSNPDVPDDYDADRMYAVINNYKDTVMVQQYVFKNIFRKAFEFYQKDNTQPKPSGNYEKPQNVMMHKDH
jgi:Domain of unknown function (DUF4340)